jgi:hypothetical protein
VFLWRPSPLLVIIAILALPQLWSAMRHQEPPVSPGPATAVRIRYGIQYLILVVALAVLALDAHERIST